MEVKIGVQNAARELTVEVDDTLENLEKAVSDAVANDGVLSLSDNKGRRIIVPVAKLAYVEIGTATSGAVGFRS